MDELDEILSIPHVDMVQFGPNDYSITDGRSGQNSSPRTQQAQRDMVEKAIKKGVAACPSLASGCFSYRLTPCCRLLGVVKDGAWLASDPVDPDRKAAQPAKFSVPLAVSSAPTS